jgi:antirestriction protein
MNEAVSVASEMWSELKRYVNTVDRDEAAETVVAILIDNDCDVDDIKDSFKGDADIKRALTAYLDDDKSYVDEDELDDEEEDLRADDWEN